MLSLLLIGLAANALTATPPPDPAAPPAPSTATSAKPADDDDKIICRNAPVTGSRLGKHVCRTKREWTNIEARSQENTNNMEMKGFHSGLPRT